MKTAKIISLVIALVLIVTLLATACTSQTPAPTAAGADCSAVESQLAAEKTKSAGLDKQVKDLQAQLAAAQKPAKVYRMEPACWIGSGSPWDFLTYQADFLNSLSDGRIESTPSAPGAVCPVEEQIEAAAAGTTLAMLATPSYYPGKIPLAALYNTGIGLRNYGDMKVVFENFQDGRAQEMYYGAVESTFNVICAGDRYGEVDCIISSTIPIPDVAALEGMKFRCGDEHFAVPLTMLGASTVWFPGTEIYTGLATGVVDAFTYGSAYDHLSLGANEVAKFWIDVAALTRANNEQFVVNKDAWNEMGADLQGLIKASCSYANWKSATESVWQINKAWETATASGVTRMFWSAEDNATFTAKQMEWAKKYTDQYPECAEFMKIMQDYDVFMGY